MTKQTHIVGSFTLPGTSLRLNRMGYGAMQLAGPQVWGPPPGEDKSWVQCPFASRAGIGWRP